MKNLFAPAAVGEVRDRIALLHPGSPRLWGKMTSAQTLAHCSVGLEMAVGDRKAARMFLGRVLGPFVKPLALGAAPLRRNFPTSKEFLIHDHRDLDIERERLYGLIDRFSSAGAPGCTTHPHTFFGPMTPEEWAILMDKHLDHHLRQFGV